MNPQTQPISFVPVQKYEYKGNFYFKVDNAQMQIGQKWITCMVYTNEDKSEMYVREFNDFLEKFKLIK
jgi:hypothetical protein